MWQKLQSQFREQVWNHPEAVRLRQKFNELDVATQSYVLVGGFAAFVFVLLLSFFLLWGRSISVKKEIARMDETIRYMQTSRVRIQELEARASQAQNAEPLLEDFDVEAPLEELVTAASLKSLMLKNNVTVTGDDSRAEAKLEHVTLRQLGRLLFLLEQSGAAATVERFTVESRNDPAGYLWATLTVTRPKGGR